MSAVGRLIPENLETPLYNGPQNQKKNGITASESVMFVKEDNCPPCIPQPIPPNLPIGKLRGIRTALGICLLLFSAYLGSIFFMAPFLPLAVLSPSLFRHINDFLITSWLMLAEFVICKILRCRVRHFGDRVVPSTTSAPHSCLFLINHRTQLDWFFVWGLGDPIQRMKIILKDSLAKVPGAGWAMQCGSFIFLRRRISTDQERLRKIVSYLLEVKHNCQLLIFPEGTDLNKISLERSDNYAVNNNLPFLRYTLHPRITGFLNLVKLIGLDHLTEVYDVTVAYPDILPSPEINLIHGQVPHEVHYLVRRFTLNDLLNNNGGNNCNNQKLDNEINDTLSKWLQNRWLEKEKSLKEYYETTDYILTQLTEEKISVLIPIASPIGKRSFENEITPDSLVFHVNSSDQLVFSYLGLFNTGIWFLSMFCLLYLIYTTFYIRIYFVMIQILFCYFTYYYNGINIWATQWINKGENNLRINDSTINSTTNSSNINANKQDDEDSSNVFIHSVQFEGIDVNKKAT
ncbi:hypothetical protein MN116_002220 [Schistosoma mekongi]|uniref:FHA domain-containing protein n=1 Tax=Schistosoma mekongi TaxID=38744 RepID=A0AAE2D8G5_SCHME|nr:hypothetical protein MN116_002220 [Schistosoma mekongi]